MTPGRLPPPPAAGPGIPSAPEDIFTAVRERPPRITVVGDAILDRWWRGTAQRMSREAPVPVVEVNEHIDCGGGAANTAANLAALGAQVRIVTTLGDDPEGRILLGLLEAAGVDASGVLTGSGTTTSKTRIVGADQIIVRVDHLGTARAGTEEVSAALAHALVDSDALIICDYGNRLFDDAAAALIAALDVPRLVVVDAHDLRRWKPLNATVVTPNADEAALLLGADLFASGPRPDAVERRARDVLAASGAAAAVITLDRDGTVAIDSDGALSRTSARPVLEQQASGAGDTFAAALTVALAGGAALAEAARFAQAAADVVVSRPGTSVCSLHEVEMALTGDAETSTPEVEELIERLAAERARGRRIVFTNGCFDVIHRGHTTHLRQARQLGDILVVALNDDDSVKRLKGEDRPVNPLGDRVAVLAALGCVDFVTVFSEDTPTRLLQRLKPDIYAKGGDYTAEMLEESDVVRAYGGEVRILDYLPSHSTTDTVRRIVARAGAAAGPGTEGAG